MRKFILGIIFFLAFSQLTFGQENPDKIIVDCSTVIFTKLSENNYNLVVQWSPYAAANRYRIKYSGEAIGNGTHEDQLINSIFTENNDPTIEITLATNLCLLQVIALDDAGNEFAKSDIFRITLDFKPIFDIETGRFVFWEAFRKSFNKMDPIAGVGIVIVIVLLLPYGGYIAYSINRQTKKQNHQENEKLREKVEYYSAQWKEKMNTKEGLSALEKEIKEDNKDEFGIFNIFEKGLENHYSNFKQANVSQEVDRDMEKTLLLEVEKISLGSYSKIAKHISLHRVKMFGEVAPMLGLLGTVSGLIVAFYNILQSSGGAGSNYQALLEQLSTGIYSAIVTTIIGLIVGIILLFIHHGVESNLKRLHMAWFDAYIDVSKDINNGSCGE